MSILYDASTDRTRIGYGTGFVPANTTFTMVLWVRPGWANGDGLDHDFIDARDARAFTISKDNAGNLFGGYWNGATPPPNAASPLAEDTWSPIVVVVDYNPRSGETVQELYHWWDLVATTTQAAAPTGFTEITIGNLQHTLSIDRNSDCHIARVALILERWREDDIRKFCTGWIPPKSHWWLEARKDLRDPYVAIEAPFFNTASLDTGQHPTTLLYRESNDGKIIEAADYHSDAIQAAIDYAATSRRAEVVLMPGSLLPYLVSSTITKSHIAGLTLRGNIRARKDGLNRSAGTMLKWTGTDLGTIMSFNARECTFSDFSFDANGYSVFETYDSNTATANRAKIGFLQWSEEGWAAGRCLFTRLNFYNFPTEHSGTSANNSKCIQFGDTYDSNCAENDLYDVSFSVFHTAIHHQISQAVNNRGRHLEFGTGRYCFNNEQGGGIDFQNLSVINTDYLLKVGFGGVNIAENVIKKTKVEPWAFSKRRTTLVQATNEQDIVLVKLEDVHIGDGSLSDIQTIRFSASATGGTFRLDYTTASGVETTANITFSETEATTATNIQTALNALSSVATATVTSPTEDTFNVTFSDGAQAGVLSVENNSLTGTAPTITILARADDDATLFDIGSTVVLSTEGNSYRENESGWPLKRGSGKWNITQDRFNTNIKLNPTLAVPARGNLIQGPLPVIRSPLVGITRF